ncbi:MazG family protein [Nitrolancea hollandica]|uniref:MazG family protein n=1 Tax=Nitrolancea hollandica Lb TaxID=1129897 RepID=I4EDR5_9BACT|nr:MazG family protein [Nitrolancea hollandica]CCF82827.1 MazG family protein [Nitrolancea hollandica Lb]
MTREINIVGLSTGNPKEYSVQAFTLLAAGRTYLRTRNHPAVAALPGASQLFSFDDWFDQASGFGNLAGEIADFLIAESERDPLVYAVPGHPLFGDATVAALLKRAEEAGVPVHIVPTLSVLDLLLPTLTAGAGAQLQILDALDLAASTDRGAFSGGAAPLSPLRPALVTQIHSPALISAARQALSRLYPQETEAEIIPVATAAKAPFGRLPLARLDQALEDGVAMLALPALDPLQSGRDPAALQQIVARLRSPGGCPWDREQTHQSIKRHLIEEAYEALDAIDRDDPDDMREELGDVLLQVYLHAQMAEEAGQFTLEDIYDSLTAKLIRRHPHVFGDVIAESAGAVLENWDQIKRRERRERGDSEEERPLGKIPADLPALARAQTVIRRAGRAGIDVPGVHTMEGAPGRPEPANEEEFAGALFALAAAASKAGIDAEGALRAATQRFERTANHSLVTAQAAGTTHETAGQRAGETRKGDPVR